jgi:hypothetical protein
MKNRLLIFSFTVSAALSAFADPTPIFNGKTLEGWEGETTNVWRVSEGTIRGGSMEGNPRNEFLTSAKTYRNFVLRLEYRLTGTEGFVNGGVQFRSKRIPNPPNEMSGFQADIGAGYSGALYDESRRNKVLAKPDKTLLEATEKPGSWNRYEIRAEGNRIRLILNDVTTVDYTEEDPSIEPAGVIGLQIHGKCRAEIEFKDIVLEELPD